MSGYAEHSTCPPPSNTDRRDTPSSRQVTAAVCAPELPHAAQDRSRGHYSLLIIIDRATTGRAACAPRAQGGGISEPTISEPLERFSGIRGARVKRPGSFLYP